MRVVVSPAAKSDLAGVWDYTFANWGVEQAALYVDALVARFQWLAENRPLWPSRDDLKPGLYGQRQGRHLIVFRERGGRLEIVRVLHQRMDVPRQL